MTTYTESDFSAAVDKAYINFEKIGLEQFQIDYLNMLRYFTSPASQKRHLCCHGGLLIHSVNVTEALLDLTQRLGLVWKQQRSPYLIGMLHDLCKAGLYVEIEKTNAYSISKTLSIGHAEESLIRIIQGLQISLTTEEMQCIRWHMGSFDCQENWNRYGEAVKQIPNVLYTHLADMIASHIMEK